VETSVNWTAQLSSVGIFLVALILGGVLGLNREQAGKPAGFRTHMLVSGAAAFLVELGVALVKHFDLSLHSASVRVDPTRIVQAIVVGIGFLGAGTILRQDGKKGVEGLTTSASILLASAIGIAVALRQLLAAAAVTALAYAVLGVLKRVEDRIRDNDDSNDKIAE
jgi:putative Mg2+ transporter-C (MgtC) family protein